MEANLNTINLNPVITEVSRDKHIDRQALVQAVEQATLAAARREVGPQRRVEARYNEDTGAVDVQLVYTVVEAITHPEREILQEDARDRGLHADPGDELVFPIFYRQEDAARAASQERSFGAHLRLGDTAARFARVAAQTARQALYVRVRAAEREGVFREFRDKKGGLVTGIVRRLDRGSIVVDLGRAEALLPLREQVPRESFRTGDRITAYVLDVTEEARGAQIVLSRAHKGLVEGLFAQHVPEIREGLVRIEASAREAGERTKIAVSARDRGVDPVGACVGSRGARVQAVGQEVRGEKIDVLLFDTDVTRLLCSAMAPARISRIVMDPDARRMELVVPDDMHAAALGRKGHNLRLAAQLTGWRLSAHPESEMRAREARAREAMAALPGVGAERAESLFRLGWRSVRDLSDTPPEELAEVAGLGGLEAARGISEAARAQVQEERLRPPGAPLLAA